MAETAGEDEEVEYRMHIALSVERVEERACDIADTFGYYPYHGSRGNGVNEGLEGYQYRESHADEAESLYVGVLLQPDKTDNGARNGTQPYEREERPAPVALGAQGNQCQWGVGACNVPVDGSMVPTAQSLFPDGATAYQALPMGAFIKGECVVDG